MLPKKSIDAYLNKQFNLYSHSSFQFGDYYAFITKLISHTEKETSIRLINQFNMFFVCSNLLDDIMDKDNEEIENISNLSEAFPIYLNDLLLAISNSLSKEEYSTFIDYVSNSLDYQTIESNSQLTIDTTEEDYFSIYIKRSVYLLQAAVPFTNHPNVDALYIATKYLAYFGQIKNDIDDLRGPKSSDLFNTRPTLPLIKTIEYAITEKNNEIIHLIFSINEDNFNYDSYDSITQFVNKNGILEHCAEIALYFFDKSQKELLAHFPDKKDSINNFFKKLIVKDD